MTDSHGASSRIVDQSGCPECVRLQAECERLRDERDRWKYERDEYRGMVQWSIDRLRPTLNRFRLPPNDRCIVD